MSVLKSIEISKQTTWSLCYYISEKINVPPRVLQIFNAYKHFPSNTKADQICLGNILLLALCVYSQFVNKKKPQNNQNQTKPNPTCLSMTGLMDLLSESTETVNFYGFRKSLESASSLVYCI